MPVDASAVQVFDSEDRAPGCPWCGGKSVHQVTDGSGRVFWYPSVGCCPVSAALQLAWRHRDLLAVHERVKDHKAEGTRWAAEAIVDAEGELRLAESNFDLHVTNPSVLEAAITEARKTGHDPLWRPVRARVQRAHRSGYQQPSPDQFQERRETNAER